MKKFMLLTTVFMIGTSCLAMDEVESILPKATVSIKPGRTIEVANCDLSHNPRAAFDMGLFREVGGKQSGYVPITLGEKGASVILKDVESGHYNHIVVNSSVRSCDVDINVTETSYHILTLKLADPISLIAKVETVRQ